MSNAQKHFEALAENPYPGRGIVMGQSVGGDKLLQVYWVMGRSENSRNRRLVEENDIVRTEPVDASKVDKPELIIYNAMRKITKANVDYHIVSNGHQTDALADELPQQDQNVEGILRKWAYEPDAPNYTPRITGVLLGKFNSFFWIAKRNSEGVVPQHAMFVKPFVLKGLGFCVHTYMGDGDPLPSFQGEPYSVPLGEDAEDTANIFWENLDPDNRVALATKSINPRTGDMNYHIINQQRQSSQP